MKLFKFMAFTVLAVVSGLGINSCADLNYGLDTNSAYPYWYGSGGPPGIGWNGPWYNAPTPLPVYWPDYGPGPIIRPPIDSRPPTNKLPVNTPSRPSVPTVTVGPNGIERPGNMGRPTPEADSSNNSKGLNLNRGR